MKYDCVVYLSRPYRERLIGGIIDNKIAFPEPASVIERNEHIETIMNTRPERVSEDHIAEETIQPDRAQKTTRCRCRLRFFLLFSGVIPLFHSLRGKLQLG